MGTARIADAMTVVGLWKLIKSEGATEQVWLHQLAGKRLAVDLAGWLFDAAAKGITAAVTKPHLRLLLYRVRMYHRNGVSVVLVGENPQGRHQLGAGGAAKYVPQHASMAAYYGASKPASTGSMDRGSGAGAADDGGYRGSRSGAGTTGMGGHAEFMARQQECMEAAKQLGVPFIMATGEAEATCAQLEVDGLVDGVVTRDGDAFLFGARTVYCDADVRHGGDAPVPITRVTMESIRKCLGLGRNGLVALASLVRSDFFPGVDGVGPVLARKALAQVPDDEVLSRLQQWPSEQRKAVDAERVLLEQKPNGRRPAHCGRCGHIGSKRAHATKQGSCVNCAAGEHECPGGTCAPLISRNVEPRCGCAWCSFARITAKSNASRAYEKVRRLAVENGAFLAEDIVRGCLDPTVRRCSAGDVVGRAPHATELVATLRSHGALGSVKDPAEYALELEVAWVLASGKHRAADAHACVRPKRIVKAGHIRKEPYVDVEWEGVAGKQCVASQLPGRALKTREWTCLVRRFDAALVAAFETAAVSKSRRRNAPQTSEKEAKALENWVRSGKYAVAERGKQAGAVPGPAATASAPSDDGAATAALEYACKRSAAVSGARREQGSVAQGQGDDTAVSTADVRVDVVDLVGEPRAGCTARVLEATAHATDDSAWNDEGIGVVFVSSQRNASSSTRRVSARSDCDMNGGAGARAGRCIASPQAEGRRIDLSSPEMPPLLARIQATGALRKERGKPPATEVASESRARTRESEVGRAKQMTLDAFMSSQQRGAASQ